MGEIYFTTYKLSNKPEREAIAQSNAFKIFNVLICFQLIWANQLPTYPQANQAYQDSYQYQKAWEQSI